MVFALQNHWNRKSRRERRQSPANSSQSNRSNIRIANWQQPIGRVAGDSGTQSVRRDSGPRSARRMVPSNDVFEEISNDTADATRDGNEKKRHARRRRRPKPSMPAKRPLRMAPAATKRHPPMVRCQIVARSTNSPEYDVKPPRNPVTSTRRIGSFGSWCLRRWRNRSVAT